MKGSNSRSHMQNMPPAHMQAKAHAPVIKRIQVREGTRSRKARPPLMLSTPSLAQAQSCGHSVVPADGALACTAATCLVKRATAHPHQSRCTQSLTTLLPLFLHAKQAPQRHCKATTKEPQRHSKGTAKAPQRHCKSTAKALQRHRKGTAKAPTLPRIDAHHKHPTHAHHDTCHPPPSTHLGAAPQLPHSTPLHTPQRTPWLAPPSACLVSFHVAAHQPLPPLHLAGVHFAAHQRPPGQCPCCRTSAPATRSSWAAGRCWPH